MVAIGMAATYRYVPNTHVKWGHAWTGGLFAAAGIELAKKLLTVYIGMVPTYSAVYGAFATVPILLVWIYVAWVIVLLGAVIAAYLPSLLAGVERRAMVHGWQFQLALEVLQQLHRFPECPQPTAGCRGGSGAQHYQAGAHDLELSRISGHRCLRGGPSAAELSLIHISEPTRPY